MLVCPVAGIHGCWRRVFCHPSGIKSISKGGRLASCQRVTVESKAAHCLALADDTLQVLQQKNRQLRSKLATLRWPPLTSVRFNGQSFPLPLQSEQPDLSRLAAHELEYLAGFFDGDGCVYATAGRCCLSVGQSIDGAEVLKYFQGALGGSICRHRDGVGLRKPTLQWTVRGSAARLAASLLAPYSIVKRKQLEICAEWPAGHANRAGCSAKLVLLKRKDSGIIGKCSWAYLAGFFDAEGHIRHSRAFITLELQQKFITVLECVQTFLASEMCVKVHVRQRSNNFALSIYTTSTSKSILQGMLDAGMLRKAAQAELALSLTSENAVELRLTMAGIVGNQNFGRRLDSAGLQRASAIVSSRQQAKRAEKNGQMSFAKSIWANVEQQKCEHELLNARRENYELHAYVDHIHAMYQD
ncbi:unnamed protein product [Symbiodinium natans]|uniref:LAGLIDADG endonuclease n=1 Tax=Symbiodinium natans TaxID=878477 RepID=A0A812P063_9DINO|nr:unnamed protein product [Symbiodinium natans]